MRIGELADATRTTVETIRFYERAGLLPAPARSSGNYRQYTPTHAERLAFIRHCRNLDMTMDEIRQLLQFRDAPGADCGQVNALLDEHIEHVEQRIRELRKLERELRTLRARCAVPGAACGILEELDGAAAQSHPTPRRHIRGAH